MVDKLGYLRIKVSENLGESLSKKEVKDIMAQELENDSKLEIDLRPKEAAVWSKSSVDVDAD
ncbi:MAG: hypothetical protein WBC21_01875 [Minisyncoccales bacterium]